MRVRALSALFFLALPACGPNANAPMPSRNEAAGVDPAARAPRVREEPREWARATAPEPTPLDVVPPPLEPVVVEDTVVTQPEAPPEPAAPRRDYGNDLREVIGDISGCLDPQIAAGLSGSLSVSVSATAMPSGRLQRASVSAGSLPRAAQDCIRARVESAMIPTPIDRAPRSISTTLRFQVTAQVTTETRTRFATDGPQPGRTQAPGVVLPALGDPGPAPGAQAPAHALPALAEPGPAPGYVAPGHTLPAQGAPPRR